MISIGRTIAGGDFKGWEVNADIDFHNYFLSVDYGNWSKSLDLPTGSYTNSGSYFRVGPDVSLLKKNSDEITLFLGIRYGQSKFKENLYYTSADPNFGDIEHNISNRGVKGKWIELTSGLKAKIWKGLWGGYTIRLKIKPSTNGFEELVPYDIPGYGINLKNIYWGFNYQVFWRIPLRKN